MTRCKYSTNTLNLYLRRVPEWMYTAPQVNKEIAILENITYTAQTKKLVYFESGYSAFASSAYLPNGWYLFFCHQIRQEVVMLGKKKPVDDWFSDLWTNARITQHLSLLCAKYLRMNFFSFLKSSPSEGIWPLKLCVNPNALWYQLPLPLSIFFHIPEIILTKVKKKKTIILL